VRDVSIQPAGVRPLRFFRLPTVLLFLLFPASSRMYLLWVESFSSPFSLFTLLPFFSSFLWARLDIEEMQAIYVMERRGGCQSTFELH